MPRCANPFGLVHFWAEADQRIASLMIGYLFTIETVRVGDLSVSAPFRYTVVVGAVVAGYLMFDEVPDALTIVGIVVIVLSGLWSMRLERLAPEPA